jgi:hypothetical protein
MSNPTGPDQQKEPAARAPAADQDDQAAADAAEAAADAMSVEPDRGHHPLAGDDPATEVMPPAENRPEPPTVQRPAERRFTAPSGFDGSTQKIDTPPDPETEIMSVGDAPAGAAAAEATTGPISQPKAAAPQVIPPRSDVSPAPRTRRSWGWVVALLLVIAALVAVAVLGTVLLTRNSGPKVSQEEMVRATIQSFDAAIQNGDLATLRGITCGATRDNYVKYDERAWAQTHARVAAAKQYPVVASIDQVVVNGDHAEANVTTFMAYAPQTRSTRSFDLEFRDEQWKICQAPNS